jgi:hypothetical protein
VIRHSGGRRVENRGLLLRLNAVTWTSVKADIELTMGEPRSQPMTSSLYEPRIPLVETLGVTLGLVVIFGGLVAARAFRMKRFDDRVARRLEQKDLQSRRHHFPGRADIEVPPEGPSSPST